MAGELEWVPMAARSTSSPIGCASAAEPSLEQAEELAGMFHLLGDVNRLRLICACMDQAVCVQDLADRFGLSPSLVSHNLRLLKAVRVRLAPATGSAARPSRAISRSR